MKTIIFALTILLISIFVFLIIPELISAQPSFPDDPEQIPIDGGLAILTAAGAGYALKKFRKQSTNQSDLDS